MEKVFIVIVYHSTFGHTKLVAETLAIEMHSEYSDVLIIPVEDAINSMDKFAKADMILFGCPTYFGTISAGFKTFMESTGKIWFMQGWKDKLAAGFTNSSTIGGDKLNTLTDLSIFAAQHGMLWVSQGILPKYEDNKQTDGQNRLGSYLGLMVTSDNDLNHVNSLHPGDQLTIQLFAKRIVQATVKYTGIQIPTDN